MTIEKMKYRKYRRMTEEEQKSTGYPTDSESLTEGVFPIDLVLGFDPFITYDEFESENVEKNGLDKR